MAVEDISSDGKVNIIFSKEIYSIDELKKNGMDMTLLNNIRHKIFEINFK